MKNQTRRVLTRTCATSLGIVMALVSPLSMLPSVQAANTKYELIDNMQDASILHCWNWSYETIEKNLELIARCGYSAIQTSPATQPKDYTYEGVVGMEVGYPGKAGSGNWWKLYQPVTESVCDNGQTWLGTKDELKSLCAKAEQYGIKVIVDVVANHMGNIKGWQNSLSDVSPQVGTYWNPEMLTDESYWHINDYQTWMSDSRLHFTQGTMGMPDLNTADKRVQGYISDLLVELIDCGVDGFRFDAAKHIETPDDDPAFASDFWPTVLNTAESHYKAKTGEDLYVYGEILNTVGDNFSINSYTKYMSVTDNSAGNHLLESYRNNNVGCLNMDYPSEVSVLWAESHDTYMNESSRYASDKSIVRTWAMVGNKDNAASLFFVRPYYSKDTLNNDQDGSFNDNLDKTVAAAIMGECETYVWASNEVAAINHFNNRMSGCSDNMGTDGNVAYCVRGEGIILVNFSGPGYISMSAHGVPDGTYTDEVSRNTFTVQNGNVSGEITSEYGIAVIYKDPMPNPDWNYPVKIKSSVADGTVFYTDSIEVEITAQYANSAKYWASTGESGTFTDSTTVTLGKGIEAGESVTLTVEGTNEQGTEKESYTFTKDEYDLTDCIFFKNTKDWSTVTAYLWNDTGATVVNNAGWPGETMFECDTNENIYALKIDADAEYNKVIFSNNGSSQTADLDCGEIGYLYNPDTNTWTEYGKTHDAEKTPSISATVESSTVTEATEVTYTVKNAESATYQINEESPVSFTGSVTLKVAENLEEGAVDTIVIEAVNGSKSQKETYTYTMDYKQPVISATIGNDTSFADSLEVTFTVENAKEATITVNGETEDFTDSVTKTFTKTSEVVVKAVNGTKDAEESYKYTKEEKEESDNFVYFNVSACGWFGNDSAVLAAKFNNQSSYTKCETVTSNGTEYYKLAVPEGATSVTVCRMLSNGNTYNEVTVSLVSGKNVWTGNSGFNGGNWSYDSAFGGGNDDEKKTTMTVYFANNYNWSGTMKAYFWGSSSETVSWPGTEMTSAGTDDNGNAVYKITIPNDITGLIFTNGSEQTVDITEDLTEGKLFTISGNSGSKYTVSTSDY